MTGRRQGFVRRRGRQERLSVPVCLAGYFEAKRAMRKRLGPTLPACDMIFRAASAVNDLRPCATARPRGSASLTAPAARNRSPPSVPAVKSGHREMRLCCVPGLVDLRHRQHGYEIGFLVCVTARETSSQGSISTELRAVTRVRSANFSASLVSWAGLRPV